MPGPRQLGHRARPAVGRAARARGWTPTATPWSCSARSSTPASTSSCWLKDAGLHGGDDYVRRYDTWLSWFDEQGIEGVGFGWLNLRRTGRRPAPAARLALRRRAAHRPGDRRVGRRRRRRGRPRPTTSWPVPTSSRRPRASPGAEDPSTIVLRQQRGLRRARQVDTVEAAFVGACDGDLSVGQIIGALAQLLEQDVDDVRRDVLPAGRRAGGGGVPLRDGDLALAGRGGDFPTSVEFQAEVAWSLT